MVGQVAVDTNHFAEALDAELQLIAGSVAVTTEPAGGRTLWHLAGAENRTALVGHEHGVHLWLVLGNTWRYDAILEDQADFVAEIHEVAALCREYFSGTLRIPLAGMNGARKRWSVPGHQIVMRAIASGASGD